MNTPIEFYIFYKFNFEQTILKFWAKYAQKRYLRSKPKIVNISIDFCILELV